MPSPTTNKLGPSTGDDREVRSLLSSRKNVWRMLQGVSIALVQQKSSELLTGVQPAKMALLSAKRFRNPKMEEDSLRKEAKQKKRRGDRSSKIPRRPPKRRRRMRSKSNASTELPEKLSKEAKNIE